MFIKKNGGLPAYMAFSLLLILSALVIRQIFAPVSTVDSYKDAATIVRRRLIIDAGHGGKDGGAVSVTGTQEKQLNLDISLTLCEMLHALGYEVILTRDNDIELTHTDGGTRKMQDLLGRLKISRDNPDAVFVSIHMNKFPQEKYSGLQVYYSQNDESSFELAQKIQNNVKTYIQQENNRKVKKADSSIFLLHRITSPAILIECGFLSNAVESSLLDTVEYRTKLSAVIACTITNWYQHKS